MIVDAAQLEHALGAEPRVQHFGQLHDVGAGRGARRGRQQCTVGGGEWMKLRDGECQFDRRLGQREPRQPFVEQLHQAPRIALGNRQRQCKTGRRDGHSAARIVARTEHEFGRTGVAAAQESFE